VTAAVDDDLFRGVVNSPPGEWVQESLCAQTDLDAFHPVKGGSGKEAKQVCARCPVQRPCLRWAVEINERSGIFGGMSPKERRGLTVDLVDEMPPVVVADQRIPQGRPLPLTVVPKVRPLPIPEPRPVPEVPEPVAVEAPAKAPRKTAECGTVSGYHRHSRLKEPYCDPCKTAKSEAMRTYWANKGRKIQEEKAAAAAKPVVRVMWLLPPATSGSHPEYAVDDGNGRFTPIHPATAAELAQVGDAVYCRHVTDWAPIGGAS
jgi:WhiB family transcriptional regulator, redox-sensing transcriptional regulator